MGLTYIISRIASSRVLWRCGVILICALLGGGLCHPEQLRGVLYFDEVGNSQYPSGTTQLAVGTKIYTLDYGEPRARHFRSKVCSDLGAIWTVTVATFDGSPYITRATCTGEVDDNVHGPWLLVRNYLVGLPGSVSSADLLSKGWRSSPDYQRFVAQVGSGDLKVNFNPSDATRFIDISSVEPAKRTCLADVCCAELYGKAVALVFEVVRNSRDQKWEIDEIKMIDPEEYWRIQGQRKK